MNNWPPQAKQYYLQGNYRQAIQWYEQVLSTAPEDKHYYWQYGLMLLCAGEVAEAQTTWLMAMMDGDPHQVELWNRELLECLEEAAQHHTTQTQFQLAWTIRQQIQEIAPNHLNNLLYLIQLSFQLNIYTGLELEEWGILELLAEKPLIPIDIDLLLLTLRQVLKYAPFLKSSVDFAQATIAHIPAEKNLEAITLLMNAGTEIGYLRRQPGIGSELIEFALQLAPQNPELVNQLARMYQNAEQYEKGVEMAKYYATLVHHLPDQVFASLGLLRAFLTTGGRWQEAYQIFQNHKQLLKQLIAEHPTDLKRFQFSRLYNASFFTPYIQDAATENRILQNQLSQLCYDNAKITNPATFEYYQKGHKSRFLSRKKQEKLKIGYLSYCLKTHSVGWLARWLIQYHNREEFELYGYLITSPVSDDDLENWYSQKFDKTYKSNNSDQLAEAIYYDEIDILIELDSVTLDSSCEVMAYRPAPIQMTWLGWDASGIPSIDYFIADDYVLPDYAQDYYQEKIIRLPQSYIAVDGFEVGVPTLRREEINVETDAVLFYSAQRGYKRNLETIRLQLQIIKAVPNSYFVIKGVAETDKMQELFYQLAQEEGLDVGRLRFIETETTEMLHRANLGMMDVVLDTYPYNGATTTLETLWMGVPLVTRVGEQFSARNSYTMLKNVGVEEGIAWTDEEYIEWGVRFGTDATLRQEVSWRLRQSRKTAPLWNGRQFTREMERVYQEVWEEYLGLAE